MEIDRLDHLEEIRQADADDFNPASENDFDTDNAKYKARMRFSVGWNDPRGVFGSAGA